MEFIDTHTHLYLNHFRLDRAEVVDRALKKKVTQLLLPNIDPGSVEGMLRMRDDFPGICFPMMGLHPTSVKENFEKELKIIENWLNKEHFIAIGETGIDLYWDKKYKEYQEEAFIIQVNWAKERKIPIVIHARNSFRELFSILDRCAGDRLQGVFHSFTGDTMEALQILEYGFFIGINGIITFENSGLGKVAEKIPPERVLLETDSPYLAPVPERGKRNESSYIMYTAKKLADIYGVGLETIADFTTINARKLFQLQK